MRNGYNSPMVRDFVNMANAMERAFGVRPYNYTANGGSNGSANGNSTRVAHLPVNVWIEDENYIIQANLPGVNPEDVDISFENETLTITGEFPKAGEDVEFVRNELFSGAFERTLNFRTPVNADAIEASYANGILTLSVPKAEEAKPKKIAVVAK